MNLPPPLEIGKPSALLEPLAVLPLVLLLAKLTPMLIAQPVLARELAICVSLSRLVPKDNVHPVLVVVVEVPAVPVPLEDGDVN